MVLGHKWRPSPTPNFPELLPSHPVHGQMNSRSHLRRISKGYCGGGKNESRNYAPYTRRAFSSRVGSCVRGTKQTWLQGGKGRRERVYTHTRTNGGWRVCSIQRRFSIHREIRMKYSWNCASHPFRYSESRDPAFEGADAAAIGNLVFAGDANYTGCTPVQNPVSDKFLKSVGARSAANNADKYADRNKIGPARRRSICRAPLDLCSLGEITCDGAPLDSNSARVILSERCREFIIRSFEKFGGLIARSWTNSTIF